jgi:HEPN domain-containing protein
MKRARIDAFLKIAGEEFEAAERLEKVLPRQSAYFLSQAVEKLLRALIEDADRVAGTSHNLGFLAGLLDDGHPLLKDFLALEHLASASTSTRYPTSTGRLYEIDALRLSDDLKSVKSLIGRTAAYFSASKKV